MGVKILSLFDGMACGMIAMQLAGVEVESYDAYEIDKYAIKTAQHNFPMIKEHGDAFDADFTQYEGVDFLVGGSPCTYWSIAQTKNRETVASGMGWELFSQYVRALHDAKPKYFIYENNKSMSKAIRASIDETFGFEAVLINSALVSAQNRQRLYWVGKRNEDGTYSKVLVEQPEDRGILLRDILETGVCWRDKSYTLDANYYKTAGTYNPKKQHSYSCLMAAEPLITTPDGKSFCSTATEYKGSNPQQTLTKRRRTVVAEPVACRCRGRVDTSGNGYAKYECREDGKSNTLDTNTTNGAMVAEPIDPRCVAKRGRYPENPKLRVAGLPTEQMFEAREDGKTNTLTTVQKDNLVAEPVRIGTYPTSDGRLLNSQGNRIYSVDGKAVTQSAQGGGWGAKTGLYAVPTVEIGSKTHPVYEVRNGLITIKGKQYPIKLVYGYYIIRKLTVRECMRLQTVPEWYEFPVSDSQSYKMLGNGWTCEVIAHLIRSTIGGTA